MFGNILEIFCKEVPYGLMTMNGLAACRHHHRIIGVLSHHAVEICCLICDEPCFIQFRDRRLGISDKKHHCRYQDCHADWKKWFHSMSPDPRLYPCWGHYDTVVDDSRR